MIQKPFLIAALSIAAVAARADLFTAWNFNSNPGDANTATGLSTPSTGIGTLTAVGVSTGTFASGFSSSDVPQTDNSAYTTTGYTTAGTQGIQFMGSSVGYKNLTVSFDVRVSGTATKYVGLYYTTNGSTFTLAKTFATTLTTGTDWVNLNAFSFSGIAAANNNPNFGVRLLQVADPSTGSLVAANGGSVSAAGTVRYDMVTFDGTVNAVPEPSALAVLALPALGLLRRRRKA